MQLHDTLLACDAFPKSSQVKQHKQLKPQEAEPNYGKLIKMGWNKYMTVGIQIHKPFQSIYIYLHATVWHSTCLWLWVRSDEMACHYSAPLKSLFLFFVLYYLQENLSHSFLHVSYYIHDGNNSIWCTCCLYWLRYCFIKTNHHHLIQTWDWYYSNKLVPVCK